jgi:hypothetical protein
MHCNWINGIKILAFVLIFLLSLKQHQVRAAAIDVDENGRLRDFEAIGEALKRAGGWQNLQGGWGKRNNQIMEYDDQTSAEYNDPARKLYYDTSKVNNLMENNVDDYREGSPLNYDNDKNMAWKRSRPGNRVNLRESGWGKREGGNWNNLRGLWGKRSTWNKLQGSWGRK